MLKGVIIKSIGGFYYVKVDGKIHECRARGLFRKNKIKPLVGDNVAIRIEKNSEMGYIEEVFERSSELIRPPVANINQVVIVFSIKNPNPNLWLLDRFLLLSEFNSLDIIICINKIDLASENELNNVSNVYSKLGYKVINTSCKHKIGINELKNVLKGKTTVFAGPSGVGKSSLLNQVQADLKLKTGEISSKTNRGKHTTRCTELMQLQFGGWVLDTPGFSSLDINFINEDSLGDYFIEIKKYSRNCRFSGCKHIKEPDCAIKRCVGNGQISKERYNNYKSFLEEIRKKRRY